MITKIILCLPILLLSGVAFAEEAPKHTLQEYNVAYAALLNACKEEPTASLCQHRAAMKVMATCLVDFPDENTNEWQTCFVERFKSLTQEQRDRLDKPGKIK
jgi:hypothetical protein